jgi:hypothetical protein
MDVPSSKAEFGSKPEFLCEQFVSHLRRDHISLLELILSYRSSSVEKGRTISVVIIIWSSRNNIGGPTFGILFLPAHKGSSTVYASNKSVSFTHVIAELNTGI